MQFCFIFFPLSVDTTSSLWFPIFSDFVHLDLWIALWLITPLYLHPVSLVHITDGQHGTFPPSKNYYQFLYHGSDSFALSIYRTSCGHFLTVYFDSNLLLRTTLWLCQPHCRFRFCFCSVMKFDIISCSFWFFNISFSFCLMDLPFLSFSIS